ncbi:competence protein CoiA family protein [Streptomyces sp. AK02-04a]|uniref:competence protein CoiA family protein n=1 Tax=Streptomyces sp. AK02-04a TaxID=3028649 RepID=UPI0029ACA501|nr:competence protein CoiA family protein [Streptomyces sp. AK02-04a]MDX3762602.1 competence protein CoiA family protein [Streptomyces sp. AK02-04a]
MAFLVRHETWGTIDSTVPDLGCGKSWDTVHRARPAAPLTCRECQHTMVPVRSPRGLRFFRHAPRAPRCSMSGGESIDHHLLKLELAQAARAAGFHAEYEVAAPDRSWRADVMATSADGTQRVALEAQLSLITPEDIQQRTNRYEQDGVGVCWFGLRPRPWVGSVPSILLNSDYGKGVWSVSAGIALMTQLDPDSSFQQWVPVEEVTLTDAVAWILTGRMKAHKPQSLAKSVLDRQSRQWPSSWVGPNSDRWDVWWTTSSHIETDIQQHNDYLEQVHIAMLRAESPMRAFRARTKIEEISALEELILKEFNNNATRSLSDFHIRPDPNYADGLAFYGYHWDGFGTMRDMKPLVVVCPDILDHRGYYWENSVPVAFPAAYRDRLKSIKNVWLFDLQEGTIWPIEPKKSVTSAALASWKSVAPVDSSSPETRE